MTIEGSRRMLPLAAGTTEVTLRNRLHGLEISIGETVHVKPEPIIEPLAVMPQ